MRDPIFAEYGTHADTVHGAYTFAAITAPKRTIDTAAQYVAVCRSIDRHCPGPLLIQRVEGRYDGRLVAVGFRREPPRAWVAERFAKFVAYWNASQARPERTGSSHNDLPEMAYRAWRAGIPASMMRSVGATLAAPDPSLRGRVLPRAGNVPHRRFARIARAAVALRRTSAGNRREEGTLKFWEALGRLCPELQRVVLDALPRGYRERPYNQRDIPWELVARRRTQMLADPTGRVRVAIATTTGANRRANGFRRAISQRELPADLPRVGDRRVVEPGHCHGGCSQCTRECESVDPCTDCHQSVWSWLPDETGRRREWDIVEEHRVCSELAPAYPGLPWQLGRRLALGDSPRELADEQLTAREAHRWLAYCAARQCLVPSLSWFCRASSLPELRSWTIARWAAARMAHPESKAALMLERTIHGPAGQTGTVRYWDRLDEIQDCDLDRGAKTGVQRAFERAAERFGVAWLDAHRDDNKLLCERPRWIRETARVRVLRTAAELIREGESLSHCVGTYAGAVASGQCIVVSIRAPFGARSTVELTPDGHVLQHRGPCNAEPPPACRTMLSRAIGGQ